MENATVTKQLCLQSCVCSKQFQGLHSLQSCVCSMQFQGPHKELSERIKCNCDSNVTSAEMCWFNADSRAPLKKENGGTGKHDCDCGFFSAHSWAPQSIRCTCSMHVPGPHKKSGERVENVTVTKMSWLQSCAYQCRFQGSATFYVRE